MQSKDKEHFRRLVPEMYFLYLDMKPSTNCPFISQNPVNRKHQEKDVFAYSNSNSNYFIRL